jgi:hypothetical protein
MTGKPRDFGAVLKARSAQIKKLLAEKKQQFAELKQRRAIRDELIAELERLEADFAFFDGSLETAINWPLPNPKVVRPKRKGRKINPTNPAGNPGNPGKWKGLLGYELVTAIRDIQAANNNCGIAEAIRKLKKQDPKWAKFKMKGGRDVLEGRFQEANEWWSQWYEWHTDLEARWKSLDARCQELIEGEV